MDNVGNQVGSTIRGLANQGGGISPGQMTRSPYNPGDGHTVATYGPTSTQIDRQATYQYYQWVNTFRKVDKYVRMYKQN